ncbi:GTP-binding protein [Psychrobium sp. 1_MG-2023]|uniref:CobW family GTP-binding protein n=1 Tax=Psychrobium sp. 1_MG-2023 TaxID=3062624 RepID=UPI002733328D|nr:GTP-binding protein [Psychrobium sp. 1_MG-2023]MDP2562277.1 GTP-binding protein [Psychrobium sp. 1_MG-2023]
MKASNFEISAIPTNIITGFLGAGKTSAILHLLKSKPDNERWAVLVNEFGEIGIDGSLFEGKHSQGQGIYIREVPGGCMCCAAGLPMQVALNQLLTKAKPDRLLIEPTGLGHPQEVLNILSSTHYHDVLSLQKTLTLVDARKLSSKQYTSHETFNQQIAIADTVIGNKSDLYREGDSANLTSYIKNNCQPQVNVIFAQHGVIETSYLNGATAAIRPAAHHHHHQAQSKPLASQLAIPECGFIKACNEGEGFKSIGWRFSPTKVFYRHKLISFLSKLPKLQIERVKAVFITNDGIFAYNLTTDMLTEEELDDCLESRVEMIATELPESLETQLMTCLQA